VPVRVDTQEVRELLAAGARAVDVLPAPTFQEEHLPGAVSLPLEFFDPAQVADWDRDHPVVVYCFDDL
jgi:rhodanese-related sulfurtransferase